MNLYFARIGAYYRLMRLDKPVGTLLLLAPTAWALWLANVGMPSFRLMIYFLLGTLLMRSAGCIVNDIADRSYDKHVQRTKMRPLTTGEVGLFEAIILICILLSGALLIVIQLPILCFFYAILSLGITGFYPLCKRFLNAPQLVLGVAFSMGIPMAYAASEQPFNTTAALLFLLNFAWIISYDTMYAMADKEDDLRIGIKSTAIYFGSYDRFIILLLQLFFHGIWLFLAYQLQFSALFYACWMVGLLILAYQQKLLHDRNAIACFKAFSTNIGYGLLMWFAVGIR